VLVTTRVVPEVGRLRSDIARRAIEEAMAVAMKRGYEEMMFQQLAQARRGPRRPAAPRSDELGRHARGLVDGAVTSRGRRAHDAGLVARDVALARGLAARRNDLAVGAPGSRVIANERRGAIE
jgi:hypothetical protein